MFAMTEPQCISNTLYKVSRNRVQQGKREITSVSKDFMPLLNFNLMLAMWISPHCGSTISNVDFSLYTFWLCWATGLLPLALPPKGTSPPSLQQAGFCHAFVGWGKHSGGWGGKVGIALPDCKACSSFKSEMPVRLWLVNMCSLEQSSVQAGGWARIRSL